MSNPTSIITKYIEEVRRLDREGTEGPWRATGTRGTIVWNSRTNSGEICSDGGLSYLNSALIAHYRTAAPRLAEALSKVVEWLSLRKVMCEHKSELYAILGLEREISHLLSDETKEKGNG